MSRASGSPRAGLVGLPVVLALLVSCSGSPAASGPAPSTSGAPSPTGAVPSRTDGASPASAPLDWSSCDGQFECATLPVPLDPDDPGAGTLDLALSRRGATGPGERIGSLLVNPGGPGASAVDFLQSAWTSIPAPVRARFDVVAFDPRGIGRSAPVRCLPTAGLDAYFALDPVPDDAAELAALEKGNTELAQGCEQRSGRVLPHVATVDTARDMDAVRAALGDDKITYLGYSYGTSLGAAYLQAYPDKVRAMVLDGGIDPTLSWDALLRGQSTGFDAALESFLADCEKTRCAFRQVTKGDLGAAFDALAVRVDRSPLSSGGPRTVGPGEFSLGVGVGLYDRENGWPAIAAALAAAERGDGSTLLLLSDTYLSRGPDGYGNDNEANLAVNCLDRPWPRDAAAYTRLAADVERTAPRFGPAIALSGLGCSVWPVPPVSSPGPVTAPGSPPVLVIGTTGDPATPYAWSVALAEQLSKGVLLSYRGEGHTVYRSGAPACVVDRVDRYLLTAGEPEPATC